MVVGTRGSQDGGGFVTGLSSILTSRLTLKDRVPRRAPVTVTLAPCCFYIDRGWLCGIDTISRFAGCPLSYFFSFRVDHRDTRTLHAFSSFQTFYKVIRNFYDTPAISGLYDSRSGCYISIEIFSSRVFMQIDTFINLIKQMESKRDIYFVLLWIFSIFLHTMCILRSFKFSINAWKSKYNIITSCV